MFGQHLRARVDQIESEALERPRPPAGIQPHLVFRVPLMPKASPSGLADRIEQIGAVVVGVEPDKAIIAFRDEVDLSDFRKGVDKYTQGPNVKQSGQPSQSTTWDVLEVIDVDHMRLWSRGDRIGPRLAEEIGDAGETIDVQRLYVVELEIWYRGSESLSRQLMGEVRRLVENDPRSGERVRDEFVGAHLCLAKVSVFGGKLNQLLELDAVAEVELPPAAVFDVAMAGRASARQFPAPPRPPEGGPRVCVIDSGIAPRHPLLENNVGSYESVLTATASGADEHGHGTTVAGIAVFGDVRECYEVGHFASEVTVYSARVMNERNNFDDDEMIVRHMERAIEKFADEPYRCRVFNLSLGAPEPWLRKNSRQSLWAECLDHLARKHKVLLVVSAGNHGMGMARNTKQAEETVREYPDYLFDDDECGLCDPATAAIALTVGGVAQYDTPSARGDAQADNLCRAVARAGQPYPCTRVGPGLGGAIKPEFVAPAGNLLFDGRQQRRVIQQDGGLAVMSLAHNWVTTGSLFRFDDGTSLAAPKVARIAARVWERLRDTLEGDIHPNTVRAVLATAAAPPQPTVDLVSPRWRDEGVRRVCGYGEIDEDFALNTGDRRVTLVAQGQITIDTVQIFALPVPDCFREAAGRKRVVVALAYDPPVRRRRARYLGVIMSAILIRMMDFENIARAYAAIRQDGGDADDE